MRHARAFPLAFLATKHSGLMRLAYEVGKESAALKGGVGPELAAARLPA